MRVARMAAALILMGAAPVGAQTLVDDTRCLLLSTVFAKAAKNDDARRAAASSTAFYLGRVDGRSTPAQALAAMRAQQAGITQAGASAAMNACAARAAQAEARLRALARQVAPAQRGAAKK